jgi:ribosomal protein S16
MPLSAPDEDDLSLEEELIAEFYESGKLSDPVDHLTANLAMDQDFILSGVWVPFVDDNQFDPIYIEEVLDCERLSELEQGAEPTEDEIALWREHKAKSDAGAGLVYMAYTFGVFDRHGRSLFWGTLHDDGGYCCKSYGPSKTHAAVIQQMRIDGELVESFFSDQPRHLPA